MAIDKLALARTMKGVNACIDSRCRLQGFVQRTFDTEPFGTAYVCIAPREESRLASANYNRIHLCGADGKLTAEGLRELFKLYDNAGVSRFFVRLSPGPNMRAVRGWLAQAGLSRVPDVGYPTLARVAGWPRPVITDLEVRELSVEEVARRSTHLDRAASAEFRRSVGASGMTHFVAYDHNRPVGSAALCVFEKVGYLGMAFTAESDRRRGAQQALIAQRIEKAVMLGCRILVSETLSCLESSLGNLRKAGFASVYEKEVYRSRPD